MDNNMPMGVLDSSLEDMLLRVVEYDEQLSARVSEAENYRSEAVSAINGNRERLKLEYDRLAAARLDRVRSEAEAASLEDARKEQAASDALDSITRRFEANHDLWLAHIVDATLGR